MSPVQSGATLGTMERLWEDVGLVFGKSQDVIRGELFIYYYADFYMQKL